LKATIGLYDTMTALKSAADGLAEPPLSTLAIVKIESGTGLTISFKGVADTVKEVKDLIIEMWSKHPHKRADEIIKLLLRPSRFLHKLMTASRRTHFLTKRESDSKELSFLIL